MSHGSAVDGAPSEKASHRTRFEGERGYIEFADNFPLFVASYVGVLDLDPLAEFLDYSTGPFFSRRKKVAYVVDLTRVLDFGSVHRKLQADWIQRNGALIETFTAGVCFALSSRVQRGLLTAVFWISKPEYPHHIVSSREEAVRWSVGQLRSADIAVPQRCIDDTLAAPYLVAE